MKSYKLLIISVLGYVLAIACSKGDRDLPFDTRGNYVINGTVFGIDSVFVENISVKLYEITADLPPKDILRDSCFTDKNGFYQVKNTNAIPYVSSTYKIHFSDLNAFYKDTTVVVIFTNESFNSNSEGFVGETFWELNIALENEELKMKNETPTTKKKF